MKPDHRKWPESARHPNRIDVLHWQKPGTERPMCNIRRGFFSQVKYAAALKFVTCERCTLYARGRE